MKTCSRCGAEKPDEEFRSYYNRPTGSYRYCKECERIETRRKYLATHGGGQELQAIEELYELRAKAGLAVPGRTRAACNGVSKLVDAQLEKMKGR